MKSVNWLPVSSEYLGAFGPCKITGAPNSEVDTATFETASVVGSQVAIGLAVVKFHMKEFAELDSVFSTHHTNSLTG